MVDLYATNKVQPPIPVLYDIASILTVDVRELLVPSKNSLILFMRFFFAIVLQSYTILLGKRQKRNRNYAEATDFWSHLYLYWLSKRILC